MKQIKYNTFTLLAIILMYSCGGGNNNAENKANDNSIAFDTLRAIKIHHLENDSTNPTCSLKITYIYPSSYETKDILIKIQQELNAAFFEDERYATVEVKTAIDDYIRNYIENYSKEMTQFTNWEDSEENSDYYSYYKTLEGNVIYNKAGLLSYQIISTDDKGGANSSTLYQCFVFNLETGAIIRENDIFVTDYQAQLSTLLIKALMKKNTTDKTDEMIDMGYFGIEDIASNNNFYVDQNGITYIFNPGEYSAPSIGAQSILIPYRDLKNILRPESPISTLTTGA